MNLRVTLEDVTQEELVYLAGHAHYKRENPRKAWTQQEYLEAARQRVLELVSSELLRSESYAQASSTQG